jgi:hypothetical protein
LLELQVECVDDRERWPEFGSANVQDSNLHNDPICNRCSNTKRRELFGDPHLDPKFQLLPAEIHNAFLEMTMIEEMLIAPIFVTMSVFSLIGGGSILRGHCCSFHQDISPICKELPRRVSELPLTVLKPTGTDPRDAKELQVNQKRVALVLSWLISNNPLYRKHGIQVNSNNLNLLPENGIPILEYVESQSVSNPEADGPVMESEEIEDA